MSAIGSTLTSLTSTSTRSMTSDLSSTSILADKAITPGVGTAKGMTSTLNPKGKLISGGMQNIRTERKNISQDTAHLSTYGLDMQRNWLPPEVPNPPEDVVVNGRGHIETRLNYANINGWLDDIPVMFTVMQANRTYEQAKLVFSNRTKRIDNTTTNRWIM